jgi:hypothetical protein
MRSQQPQQHCLVHETVFISGQDWCGLLEDVTRICICFWFHLLLVRSQHKKSDPKHAIRIPSLTVSTLNYATPLKVPRPNHEGFMYGSRAGM